MPHDRRVRTCSLAGRNVRGALAQALLDDAQMHLLGADLTGGGLAVQKCARSRSLGGFGLRPLHAKSMAAPANLHLETRLDQPQIGIQRATQTCQPRVVGRR